MNEPISCDLPVCGPEAKQLAADLVTVMPNVPFTFALGNKMSRWLLPPSDGQMAQLAFLVGWTTRHCGAKRAATFWPAVALN